MKLKLFVGLPEGLNSDVFAMASMKTYICRTNKVFSRKKTSSSKWKLKRAIPNVGGQ